MVQRGLAVGERGRNPVDDDVDAPHAELRARAESADDHALSHRVVEAVLHLHAGETPSHSTFLAIYYTLTGLHGLHIVGGMIVMAYFLGPGAKLWKKNPTWFTNRVENSGLFWHFVDLVWIFLFPTLYLL